MRTAHLVFVPLFAVLLAIGVIGCGSEATPTPSAAPTKAAAPSTTTVSAASQSTPTKASATATTPTSSATKSPAATATKNPADVIPFELVGYRDYAWGQPGMRVYVGEVQNKKDVTAMQIMIELGLLDDKGNTLVKTQGSHNLASLWVAPPNGKYPFRFEIPNAPEKVAKVQANVDARVAQTTFTGSLLPVEVTNVKINSQSGSYQTYWVSGDIKNTSAITVSQLQGVAVVYGDDGKVIDLSVANIKYPVAPGGQTQFLATDFRGPKTDKPTKVYAYLQGVK